VIVISIVLLLGGIYVSFYVAYWLIILIAHCFASARRSAAGPLLTRFAVVIPAHDEELLLPRLLASIRSQDYPSELFDTIVVADNCTDRTADVARRQGFIALERDDDDQRGKGYAIKWALEMIDLKQYDAVLIVDADCFIGTNTLKTLAGRVKEEPIIQCYNGVGNPDESWFTRLLDVSRTINNYIYSPAKQRLGLSSELTGTGMCFATRVLSEYGWDAFTVGEDWEYYAKLILKGERVGFEGNARVYHEESSSLKQATRQRMRWSSGRFAVAWRYGFRLLSRGVIEHDAIKFDAGLCLILPNPSLGMNVTLVLLVVALLTEVVPGAFTLWLLLLALGQLGLFVGGVFYTENRLSKFLAIFVAPAFLAWKMGIDALSLLGVGRKEWVRTHRKR